jgi:eukaryotic-like serine/threonine-protein kinase
MQPLLSSRARFGTFELNTDSRELHNGTQSTLLQEQSYKLLVLLLLNGNAVTRREAIQNELWESDTTVDYEGGINAIVRNLRRILDDSATEPKYIQTLPRQGYRFLVPADWAPLLSAGRDGTGLGATAMPPVNGSLETITAGSVPRRQDKRKLLVPAVLFAAVALAAGFLYYRSHRKNTLTETDIVVLADFTNRTGDPVFDDTLKTALSVALRQSPFLNVLPDNKVASTLQLMARPASTALTPDVAREVCERANGEAYITGSIVALGHSYVLALKAVSCLNGDLLAQEQVTAPAKENVLDSLGQAASRLRGQMGESLVTVERYDVPLEQATTPSLDALKEYSIAHKIGSIDELPHLRHAVELDPNFAMGYVGLGWHYWGVSEIGEASQYFTKAFELREHASKLERLRITADYYTNVTGELDKAQQIYSELTANYPRSADLYPWNIACGEEGRYEEELATYHNFLLRNPSYFVISGDDFGITFLALQRFDEARQAFQRVLKRGDNFLVHTGLYALAFLEGDSRVMAEQQDWYAKQGAYRTFALALASDTELYEGRLTRAKVLTSEAEEYAIREDWRETAAIWQQNIALGMAAVGNLAEARRLATAALELAPTSPAVEAEAAIAFAMSGETFRATALAKELSQRFPKDTQMQTLWLPSIRSQVALERKNPSAAISELRNTLPPIEYGQIMFLNNISCLYHTYIRGQAFLAARQGEAAATEFQKILDHSGVVWNCWTGSLARLGVARANALQSSTLHGAEADAARARSIAAYKDFLTLWKDADPDVPIYRQAKAEYAKLQ